MITIVRCGCTGCGGKTQNTGVSVVFKEVPRGFSLIAGESQAPNVLVSRLVLVNIEHTYSPVRQIDWRLAFGTADRPRTRPDRRTCDHPRTRTDQRINHSVAL